MDKAPMFIRLFNRKTHFNFAVTVHGTQPYYI